MIGVFYTINSHERAEVYSILPDGITAFALNDREDTFNTIVTR